MCIRDRHCGALCTVAGGDPINVVINAGEQVEVERCSGGVFSGVPGCTGVLCTLHSAPVCSAPQCSTVEVVITCSARPRAMAGLDSRYCPPGPRGGLAIAASVGYTH